MPSYNSTLSAESKSQSSEDQSFEDDFFVKCRLNHPPISHVERAKLESLIYKTSQALQSISDPESRDHLPKILGFQRSLLSPIQCLPPDVMGEIFSFIIAGNPIQYGSKKTSTTILDAWKLTWNASLRVPASCHWISLEARYKLLSECSLGPDSVAVLNILVDEVARWKHLKFVNFAEVPMDDLVAMILPKQTGASSPLPLLQSLTLGPCQTHAFGAIFMHCPSLRKLRIFRLKHTDVAIEIQNLVDLEIVQIHADAPLANLLRACPLLQTLTVGYVSERGVIPQESFSHTHLTTLNLSYLNSAFSPTVWEFVRLPKLIHLDIRAHGNLIWPCSEQQGVINISSTGLETVFDALLDMLLSSDCSLQTAAIYNVLGVSRQSFKGCFLHSTDTIVDDFLAKLPVSSTGQRILINAEAGVNAEFDFL
ncbi:hypothetical protein BDP27DRAFT_1402866 [Rhodocollybia butyracea]|uniref:Uncharacterized protein n=1 Tax=Rhodocollybia butyracea TaxID=206335 RepID=A0A9P5U6K2_9AGAR|nr:hypothetical protein BDP27DRAFT_1402866 [Rhodocollybia butyracea]